MDVIENDINMIEDNFVLADNDKISLFDIENRLTFVYNNNIEFAKKTELSGIVKFCDRARRLYIDWKNGPHVKSQYAFEQHIRLHDIIDNHWKFHFKLIKCINSYTNTSIKDSSRDYSNFLTIMAENLFNFINIQAQILMDATRSKIILDSKYIGLTDIDRYNLTILSNGYTPTFNCSYDQQGAQFCYEYPITDTQIIVMILRLISNLYTHLIDSIRTIYEKLISQKVSYYYTKTANGYGLSCPIEILSDEIGPYEESLRKLYDSFSYNQLISDTIINMIKTNENNIRLFQQIQGDLSCVPCNKIGILDKIKGKFKGAIGPCSLTNKKSCSMITK